MHKHKFTRAGMTFVFIFAGLGIINLFNSSKTDTLEDTTNSQKTKTEISQTTTSPFIPDQLMFAGEAVPLHQFDIKERLDKELIVNTYFHSQTIQYFKRANRWFPVIEPILKKNGIPEDFKYLALVESGFENVISGKGATGFWQFMPKTAGEYGLEVNNEVDERYSPDRSTEAACKYLKKAYEKYGNWTLSAASYNVGMHGIDKQLDRQKAHDLGYYDLLLNGETERYVFRILAVKQIFENPEKYNFHFNKSELYPPFEYSIVEINGPVEHFTDFANKYGLNYKQLKLFNPWLRDNYLTNRKGKTYEIKIPEKEFFEK